MMERVWSHASEDFPGREAVVLEDSGAMQSYRRYRSELLEDGQAVKWEHHASFPDARLAALKAFYGDLEMAMIRGAL